MDKNDFQREQCVSYLTQLLRDILVIENKKPVVQDRMAKATNALSKFLESAVRAASTVTLVRLPAAATVKSKSGFIRGCKRLIAALDICLPQQVMAAMERAGE